MKSIIAILLYTGTFMGLFFLFSLIGLLWTDSYYQVVSNHTWFMMYTFFFGWWVALLPLMEYYKNNKAYFDEIY